MKSSAFKALALGSLLMMLASCTPIEGNSLLTDQKDDPSSHLLDKTPKSEELYLRSFNPTINSVIAQTKAEVSGECYISTYPSHRIIATIGGAQISIVDINTTTPSNIPQATCKNGKFNLALDLSNIGIGVHTVRLVLQAVDSNGNTIVNDAQGVTSLTLTRSN